MLEDIKTVLGLLDASVDDVLNIMIKDAAQSVKDYCHINRLPEGLEWVVRQIVIRAYKLENEGDVASIKRGDTQISYNNPINPGSFTEIQKSAMNKYRKLIKR